MNMRVSLLSIILSYTLFTSILIKNIDSQCSNLDSNTCELDGYCVLNSNSHCICGQIAWNQDIAFIFDSSMSSLEWTYSIQFAANLLYYGSPSISTTRTAIFETADASNISTNTLSFGAEPLSITINETLPNLAQTKQSDFYLQKALQSALDLFTSSSSSSRRKIVIIFASQEFKQSPCKINMRANEIYTYTIAIGNGWNNYPLICVGSSENNYEGLRSVTDASQLQSILSNMEAITCPHEPLIKLTEIQLSGVNGEQYIELYNYGHSISDMSQFSISGIGSKSLPSISLLTGRLAVIYNTDQTVVNQTDIPNCGNCTCSEDSNTSSYNVKWCDSAQYMGCCNSCDPNNYVFEIVSDCQFNTGLSMTSFTIEILWINPINLQDKTVESVTFNANQYWPTVATNYALELKNKGYNNQFGSSWSMSCDTDGTPGDDYGSVICSYDCPSDGNITCNLSGGMLLEGLSPGCVGSTGSCKCINGYYPYYLTCLPLPSPFNCIATYITGSSSRVSFTVAPWDGDTTYTYLHCERNDLQGGCTGDYPNNLYAETSTSFINPVVYDPGRNINSTHFVLSAIGSGGEKWYSKSTNCTQVTGAPTTEPTPSPTYSVPIVPSCNISLSQDMKSFDIQWQPINMQQFGDTAAPNDTFLGYVYYYNGVRRSTATQCCIDSGTPPGGVTYDILSDQVSVSGDWDSTFTDVTTLDELLSATNCSISTLEPTPTPTNDPTVDPTSDPTRDPSKPPTKSPTLQELFVPNCSATVLQGSKTFDMEWSPAIFNSNTAPIEDTKYAIEWFYFDGRKGGESVSANQGPRAIQVDDYLNVTLLQMYCSWSGGYERGQSTNCTIYTLSPTPSPTNNPTDDPSPAPTDYPTTDPTIYPTLEPTLAPTYRYDDVSKCHAVFSGETGSITESETVTLTWDSLEFDIDDTNPNIPPKSWINYVAIIGNGIDIIFVTQDFVTCNGTNQCIGKQTEPLTPNTGDDILFKVTFFAYYEDPNGNGQRVYTTNIINCTIDTPEPTNSPTLRPSLTPTMSPTLGAIRVHLDNTACPDERCGCTSFIDSDCCYNDCDISWELKPAPIIIVSEKSKSNTTFYVKRSVAEYPYSIEIEFNITAVNQELAEDYGFYSRLKQIEAGDFSIAYLNNSNLTGNLTANSINITYTIPDDCYFDEWNNKECEYFIDDSTVSLYSCSKRDICSWCDFYEVPGPRCNDIIPNNGKFIIPHSDLNDGGTFETSTFELAILTEGCDYGCDFKGEVFLLELTGCSVYKNYDNLLSSDQLNKLGATSGDILNCSLVYPSRAYIIITDQDPITRTELIEIPDSSYEDWLWYVILGAVIILAVLSYIAYRWWVNKKMKEADVAQVEEDMEAVIEEQEQGWEAANDAQIAPANPLANIGGVHRPIHPYNAQFNQTGTEKIKDIANVNIEKFDERVEYGQQRGGDDAYGDVI